MKRTVLLIDAFAEEGGAEVVLRTYLRHLDRHRFRPVAVFLSPGPLAGQLRELGVRVYVFPRHRRRHAWKVAWVILAIAAIARREKAGIVHSNGFGPHLYGSFVALLARCRSVWQIYDPPTALSWRQSIIKWLYLRLPTSRYVFSADITRDVFLKGKTVTSPTMLYPASDRVQPGMTGDSTTLDGDVRTQFGLGATTRVVLMLARLQPTKGHDTLLQAAPHILQAFPDTRFVIVGGSLFGMHKEYGRNIQKTVQLMGLNDAVIFTGFCDNETVRTLLFMCELLVHPAFGEPFGLAVTEAMAAGKPVVATRVEGPARIVLDGQTGILVEPGDVDALAAAICRLLQDPVEARAMGRRGLERVSALYSATTLIDALEKLYDSLWKVG